MARRNTPQNPEWYVHGLRFECSMCGNCCTGPPGAVWFEDDEAEAMAQKLGIDLQTFFDTYTHVLGDRRSLKENETEHGHDCVFLDRDTIKGKAICSLYEARPTQCGTWPFWPENLESKRAWAMTKRTTPCPGMDNGPLIPIEKIRIQRDATPDGWDD